MGQSSPCEAPGAAEQDVDDYRGGAEDCHLEEYIADDEGAGFGLGFLFGGAVQFCHLHSHAVEGAGQVEEAFDADVGDQEEQEGADGDYRPAGDGAVGEPAAAGDEHEGAHQRHDADDAEHCQHRVQRDAEDADAQGGYAADFHPFGVVRRVAGAKALHWGFGSLSGAGGSGGVRAVILPPPGRR